MDDLYDLTLAAGGNVPARHRFRPAKAERSNSVSIGPRAIMGLNAYGAYYSGFSLGILATNAIPPLLE